MSSSESSSAKNTQTITRDLTITNSLGLHARPAALFVKIASGFESDITVVKDKTAVSGKSIMGLMTLEVCCGAMLRITAVGPDAEEVLAKLQHLIENKFFED